MSRQSPPEQRQEAPRSRYRWGQASGLLIALSLAGVALFLYGPFRHNAAASQGESDEASRGSPLKIAAAPLERPEVLPGELEPVAEALSKALERPVRLSRGETVEATLEALLEGSTEIALLDPLVCVQARERTPRPRYLVVQGRGGSYSEATLLVARQGTPRPSGPEALRGQRLCRAEASISGLLPRLWLRNHGIDPEGFFSGQRQSQSQAEALEDLLDGDCDLAAVDAASLHRASRGQPDRFTILARTGRAPGLCWLASPHLEERVAHAVELSLSAFDPREVSADGSIGQTLEVTGFSLADGSTYLGVRVAAQLERLLRPGLEPDRP